MIVRFFLMESVQDHIIAVQSLRTIMIPSEGHYAVGQRPTNSNP